MSNHPADKPKSAGREPRAINRRSFLAAAPAAGLAAGAAAIVGAEEAPPPGADPDRHLAYSETPHIQAYYRRARF